MASFRMNKATTNDDPPPTTVLCVDDEPAVRDMLALYLTRRGYEVATADDGDVALRLLLEDLARFDLVVTDNQMPTLSGVNLVVKLREHGYAGGIVMFSSTVPPQAESQLTALRVHVVRKGGPIRELMAVLEKAKAETE